MSDGPIPKDKNDLMVGMQLSRSNPFKKVKKRKENVSSSLKENSTSQRGTRTTNVLKNISKIKIQPFPIWLINSELRNVFLENSVPCKTYYILKSERARSKSYVLSLENKKYDWINIKYIGSISRDCWYREFLERGVGETEKLFGAEVRTETSCMETLHQ